MAKELIEKWAEEERELDYDQLIDPIILYKRGVEKALSYVMERVESEAIFSPHYNVKVITESGIKSIIEEVV